LSFQTITRNRKGIIMNRITSTIASMALFAAATSFAAGSSLAAQRQTIVTNVSATRVNGGINPSFYALIASGDILVGGAECEAAGLTAKFIQRQSAARIDIYPVVLGNFAGRDCPPVYRPVFIHVELRVGPVNGAHIRNVIIHNVNELGNNVDASSLVVVHPTSGCVDASLAGMCSPSTVPTTEGCPVGQNRCAPPSFDCADAALAGQCAPTKFATTDGCFPGQSRCVVENPGCVDAGLAGMCGPGQMVTTQDCSEGKNRCVPVPH
jgi:hypothetical protein